MPAALYVQPVRVAVRVTVTVRVRVPAAWYVQPRVMVRLRVALYVQPKMVGMHSRSAWVEASGSASASWL